MGKNKKDEANKLHFGAGHIIKPPQFEGLTMDGLTKEEVEAMQRDMEEYQRELDIRIDELERYKFEKGWISHEPVQIDVEKARRVESKTRLPADAPTHLP